MKITLPQQSLNLLRQLLSEPGWCKTTKDLYLGGRLLAETLPEVDTSWIKFPQELAMMTSAARAAYFAEDKAWSAQPVEFEISDSERDAIRCCIEKLTESGVFKPSRFAFKLIEQFGFKPD